MKARRVPGDGGAEALPEALDGFVVDLSADDAAEVEEEHLHLHVLSQVERRLQLLVGQQHLHFRFVSLPTAHDITAHDTTRHRTQRVPGIVA
jgi:hypothetical protein